MNKLARLEKEKGAMTKQSLDELGEIFTQFGMAPTDLNIPAFTNKLVSDHGGEGSGLFLLKFWNVYVCSQCINVDND
jgi:hypothetical protein